MIRAFLLFTGIVVVSLSVEAQTDSLVGSGVVINSAKRLYDSGKYELAIKELLHIDPRDTNYVYSLSELTRSYFENKQYDKTILSCEKGLVSSSPFRSSLLNSMAKAYAAQGNFEKAYSILTGAINEFPFDYRLTYRYGVILYEQKKFNEAEVQLFKTIDLNPFHSGAHLYLSEMSMLRGQKVSGMFSMGIYLALNNTMNSQLVVLEHFVKNELTDEYTIPPSPNSFERLDEFIRAKISFEDDYKTKIPIDLGVVKQYQLLFDQLGEQKGAGDDPWMKFYGTVYTDLRKANVQEPFIYHLLESTPIKQVAQWKEKNKKMVQQFYDVMNASLTQFRKSRTLPERWGYKAPVHCAYYDDASLESFGTQDQSGKKNGKWYYFDENGVTLAYGNYVQDKKVGVWNYFTKSGIPSSVENYDTGEMTVMDSEGKINRTYIRKEDKIEGTFKLFYSCGTLSEQRTYHNGKRDGPGKAYYENGKVQAEFSFREDSLNGKFINWHDNGIKEAEQEFEMGHNIGKYISWYRNGNLSVAGNYDHGKTTGAWLYYFANGKLKQKRNYQNDIVVGDWNVYNANDELVETKKYNEKGKLEGDDQLFHEGKPHYTIKYSNDLIVSMTYYNKAGSVISRNENAEGTLKGQGFFPTGEVRVDFNYLKGVRDGAWKYYYRVGQVQSRNVYKNDELEGESLEYYEDGTLKSKSIYVRGQLEGPYSEYYQNGTLKSTGWYQAGDRQHDWVTYFSDGSKESDSYYLNGKPVGYTLNFTGDGKLFSRLEFDQEGNVKTLIRYRQDGSQASDLITDANNHTAIVQKYQSGQVAFQSEIICGHWDGQIKTSLPDQKPFRTSFYSNGKRNGKYLTFYPDGAPEGKGEYSDDKASGTWSWYHDNGNKHSEGNYLGDGKDSLWTYYFYNGEISATVNFLEDKKQGESRVFAPGGQLLLYKMFEDNDLISYRSIGKDGKLGEWIPFSGNGKIVSYFSNGNLAIEENYANGKYDKARRIFYPNGNVYSLLNYTHNLIQGEGFIYYPNGKIKEKLNYKDDAASGNWEYYEPNGMIQRREPYVLGVLDGKVEFFSHGNKTKEQKFWGGAPID